MTTSPLTRLGVPALLLLTGATAVLGLGHQPLRYPEITTAYASGLPWHGRPVLLGQTDANLGAPAVCLYLSAVLAIGAVALQLCSEQTP